MVNFLLVWWNGDDWGYFLIVDLFGVDCVILVDMVLIFVYFGEYFGVIYVDVWGYCDVMVDLVELWWLEVVVV